MARLPLTMALEHYDRHVPLLDGTVTHEALDLTVLHVGQVVPSAHGRNRHERMIRAREFDVAEVSLSSYLMAKDQGLPLTAIPIFPRRLFSQPLIYCHAASGIGAPRDLVDKRVGVNSFQTTLSVLAKGDLQEEYDVPWRTIHWYTVNEEALPFAPPARVDIRTIPEGRRIDDMVAQGELDAVILPHPPRGVLDGRGVRRLFADARAETLRYFRKNGYFPIMHVVALKTELAEHHPWIATALFETFERAWALARDYYDDPNWSRLAWARLLAEDERAAFGKDPWPNGLAQNRANLERFIRYESDQGLIKAPMPVESLFIEATLAT
jgi:4,5-dihydroxyphthalate decarboxylase